MLPHEHAVPEVLEMLERVRAMRKAFYGQERQRKALLDLPRRLEVTYMVVDLDNSKKCLRNSCVGRPFWPTSS